MVSIISISENTAAPCSVANKNRQLRARNYFPSSISMELAHLTGMNGTAMRINTKRSDTPFRISIDCNSFEKHSTLRTKALCHPNPIFLLFSTFFKGFRQPISNTFCIMSFYNCKAFGDAHYYELEAQLRAYKRRVTELEFGLADEKKLRKRAEIDLREVTEERQEYRKRTKTKVVRLQRKLRIKSEALEGLHKDLEDKALMIELGTSRQKWLEDTLDLAKADLEDEREQRELDAIYHRKSVLDLEAKNMQATKAQLAMQLQLEELQQNQDMILDELSGTGPQVRTSPSQGGSGSGASGSKEILDGLKKAPSRIAAKLGSIITKRRSSSGEKEGAEGRTGPNASAEPITPMSSPARKVKLHRRWKSRIMSPQSPRSSSDSDSSGGSEYTKKTKSLRRMERSSKVRRAFRGRQLYYQSLAQAREDTRHQGIMLESLVKAQQDQIDVLKEELTHERMRNRQLHAWTMTKPRKSLEEVSSG